MYIHAFMMIQMNFGYPLDPKLANRGKKNYYICSAHNQSLIDLLTWAKQYIASLCERIEASLLMSKWETGEWPGLWLCYHTILKNVYISLRAILQATIASVKKCTYGVGSGNLQLQHFCDIFAWEYLDNCHKY